VGPQVEELPEEHPRGLDLHGEGVGPVDAVAKERSGPVARTFAQLDVEAV
jgi:hypothetical protein